ncbi:MAG: DUF992 domain-containing protein [Hyphomicrobiaceae bacterium]|nr:MAG: DUF992 domain-containing protein [Hyphomicrobiaceae bacterium]
MPLPATVSLAILLAFGAALPGGGGLANIGVLTCSTSEGGTTHSEDDFSQGARGARSVLSMLCTFRPVGSGPEESYVGTVQVVGTNAGRFERATIILQVNSMVPIPFHPGLLEQGYSVERALKLSRWTPLTGETKKAIMLQPIAEREGPMRHSEGSEPPTAVILSVTLKLRSTSA